jgi:hypothetical protein
VEPRITEAASSTTQAPTVRTSIRRQASFPFATAARGAS